MAPSEPHALHLQAKRFPAPQAATGQQADPGHVGVRPQAYLGSGATEPARAAPPWQGISPKEALTESGRFRGVRGKTVPTGTGKLRACLNLRYLALRFINFASCSAA